jgi:hypothetical protein
MSMKITARENSPWKTPMVEIRAGHAITSFAIREAIRTDKTLRKLQGALSVGALPSALFQQSSSLIRKALTRFSERITELKTEFLPEGEQIQEQIIIAPPSGASNGTNGKSLRGIVHLRVHHPITKALAAVVRELDTLLREAMARLAMETLPLSRYDALCGVKDLEGAVRRQGQAERAVEQYAMDLDAAVSMLPPAILAPRPSSPSHEEFRASMETPSRGIS